MNKTRYLIRLDDACPTMSFELWGRMESLLDKYDVKPMVGIIPHNDNPDQMIDPENPLFWNLVDSWKEKGWTIALHGYNHVYSSNDGGINPLWNKSEFAGHPLDIQREKIRKGVSIMREHNIDPAYFFAPKHTFDENTLIALKEESGIRIISDTIAFLPYRYRGFVFIPQQTGHPIKLPFGGLVTICYHPNTMKDAAFQSLELFLQDHKGSVLSFDEIDASKLKGKSLIDRVLSWIYFLRRKIR